MGLFDKIRQKTLNGAGSLIKNKIKSTIKNLIKEKRLVFMSAESISYTNKAGLKREINLDEMTEILVDASGVENLLNVGVTPDDVRDLLVEGWNKRK